MDDDPKHDRCLVFGLAEAGQLVGELRHARHRARAAVHQAQAAADSVETLMDVVAMARIEGDLVEPPVLPGEPGGPG